MSKKTPTAIKDLPATDTAEVKGGALDGINRLITVTQMKSNNANESVLAGADKQRVISQKTMRG